jgi:hypothetical protein
MEDLLYEQLLVKDIWNFLNKRSSKALIIQEGREQGLNTFLTQCETLIDF